MPDSSGEALFDLALIDRHVHSDTFVERAWAYRAVEAALATPGIRLVLLTGDPGSGKSAIMAGLAAANPGWPRYFIRRVDEESDGEHRRSGDLASFLIVTGLQLAALWPQRLSDLSMAPAYQEVGEVGPDGETVAVAADALIANPFRAAGQQVMVEVHQRAGKVRGKLTGVDVGTLVLEPRLRPLVVGMTSISQRPAEAAGRKVPGHWEGDLVIGKQGKTAMGTLVERASRYLVPVALPDGRDSESVCARVIDSVRDMPSNLVRSITWDQGAEMAAHAALTLATDIPVYFAHAHSPWERGTNENTNGLLREYFPKGTDITGDINYLQAVADEINGRPRAILDFRTPAEVFAELLLAENSGGSPDLIASTG